MTFLKIKFFNHINCFLVLAPIAFGSISLEFEHFLHDSGQKKIFVCE